MNASMLSIPSHDGKSFNGYLSLPPTGVGPGLILIQEIFGVNEHIRSVADQYALDGYVVLAPDLFWRQKPGVELAYVGDDYKQAYQYMNGLDGPNALHDLQSTAQALRGLPQVQGKVGTIGFCMGGRLSYALAAAGAVDAAVCYYGGGIQNNLGVAAAVNVPIQFHYGALDSHIPAAAIDAVKGAFDGRDNAQFHVYEGAEHGFNCWARASYNRHAALVAHGNTLHFLAEAIG